jgi:hypothetical protein
MVSHVLILSRGSFVATCFALSTKEYDLSVKAGDKISIKMKKGDRQKI